jgi:hypothetical protein
MLVDLIMLVVALKVGPGLLLPDWADDLSFHGQQGMIVGAHMAHPDFSPKRQIR